jgi:hypothetical protein
MEVLVKKKFWRRKKVMVEKKSMEDTMAILLERGKDWNANLTKPARTISQKWGNMPFREKAKIIGWDTLVLYLGAGIAPCLVPIFFPQYILMYVIVFGTAVATWATYWAGHAKLVWRLEQLESKIENKTEIVRVKI